MLVRLIVCVLGFSPLGFCLCAAAATNAVRVSISDGMLIGSEDKATGVRSFKGIPFAQPPVGALRWREPQPVMRWEGERKATEFGPRCMQRRVFDDMVFRSNGMSEDCLYLNVWTPAKSASERLPVLLYFYGGGFVAGDGSEPRYDGTSMAQKGIVTVTANYRLNVFGRLAHPELTAESPHKASGNYSFLDQHAALRWVRANIAAFGGDPDRITIAGESAGSASVSAHMASPLSRDLIAGAIGESGAMLAARGGIITLAEAEQAGEAFTRSIGAESLAELRALPAERLLELAGSYQAPGLYIVVDGYFLAKTPDEVFAAEEQAKVPLLAGSNSEELSFASLLQGQAPTVENYKRVVETLFGAHAERLLQRYPATSEEEVRKAGTELASDIFMGYSTWRWVEVHARSSDQPVFYYYYAHPRPPLRNDPTAPVSSGAVHSAEIEYALGNLDTNEVFAWTQDDYQVSRLMQAYFANFIKSGNANGEGLPSWPTYHSASFPRLIIDTNPRVVPDERRAKYQLLDAVHSAR